MIFLKAIIMYVLHRKTCVYGKKEMALVKVGHVSIVDWASLSSKENRRESVIQRLARIF